MVREDVAWFWFYIVYLFCAFILKMHVGSDLTGMNSNATSVFQL